MAMPEPFAVTITGERSPLSKTIDRFPTTALGATATTASIRDALTHVTDCAVIVESG